jgi:hypothetical protein
LTYQKKFRSSRGGRGLGRTSITLGRFRSYVIIADIIINQAEYVTKEIIKILGHWQLKLFTKPKEVQKWFSGYEAFWKDNILINNAGINIMPSQNLRLSWEKVLDINLKEFLCSQSLESYDKTEKSKIINIAAIHGLVGSHIMLWLITLARQG